MGFTYFGKTDNKICLLEWYVCLHQDVLCFTTNSSAELLGRFSDGNGRMKTFSMYVLTRRKEEDIELPSSVARRRQQHDSVTSAVLEGQRNGCKLTDKLQVRCKDC